MKTLKKLTATALITSAAFVSSCKQAQTLPLSVTEHEGLKISGASLKGIKGEMTVNIKNPNPSDITVYRSKLNVKLNGIPVGKAKIKKHIVPANSEIEEVLYFKSNFSDIGYFDIPKVIKSTRSKDVKLSVKGQLQSGKYAHKTMIPVNITDTIDLEEKTKPIINFLSNVGKKGKQLLCKKKCEN
jgi:LEA14-like dessication related protein